MTLTPTRRAVAVVAAALLGASAAWMLAPRDQQVAFDELPRSSGPARLMVGTTPTIERGSGVASARGRPASIAAVNRAAREAVAPRRLSMPRLGVSLPVRPTGLDDRGQMALPESAYTAGWYRFGRGPLDPRGATVIAGHVDTTAEGVGPLARLASARAGDEVRLSVGDRLVRYRVLSVQRVAKNALDLPTLFARDGARRLHVVTCGGAYLPAQGGYQDNVVLTARPL